MPYSADLRCGYATTEMNMSWIYSLIEDELNCEIEFGDDMDKEHFEKQIEKEVNNYIKYTVFWIGDEGKNEKYLKYDSVWDYLSAWILECLESEEWENGEWDIRLKKNVEDD